MISQLDVGGGGDGDGEPYKCCLPRCSFVTFGLTDGQDALQNLYTVLTWTRKQRFSIGRNISFLILYDFRFIRFAYVTEKARRFRTVCWIHSKFHSFNYTLSAKKQKKNTEKMTKLMEWVSVLVVFSSFYLSIVTGQIKSELLDHWMFQILIFPFLAVLLFGVSFSFWFQKFFCPATRFKYSFYNFIFLFTDLFGRHHFLPRIHIKGLPRSCRRNSKTNCRSQSWFKSQRT